MQGDQSKFIAIEMVKRRIRMLWNLGGNTGIITHSLEIQTRDPNFDDAWYHIEANRTMNLGSLNVRRMANNGSLLNSNPVSDASSMDFTRISISPNNRFWLGGTPPDIKPNELVNEAGLGVIMQQLYIDDDQIGLWHFAHSQGECGGSEFGPVETSATSNARYFNGDGYSAVMKLRSRPFKKNFFSIQMTFRTLDENALLFLAVDEKNV